MTNEEKKAKREAFEKGMARIVKRAATDEVFRQLCLTDPGAAYKAEAGADLESGFKLRFVDNQRATMTVVLPDPPSPDAALADEELDQVAGGTFFQDVVHGCQSTCRASAGSNTGVLCGTDVVH